MKSNNTQYKTRQRQFLCYDFGYFACKIREAIITVLTERAAPLRRSLWGSKKALNLAKLATLSISTTHLSLSDCSARIFRRTHTYRNIWITANQRGGPPFTISDWFRPRYKPNGSVFCWTTGRLSETRRLFFFFERLVAPVRPQIYVSRTTEKLGCTCTLEPCV